ncbi:hypothetical protein NQ318_001242 [Aromia moschata]|uniref:Uncharacterized protein n=1 Tax=Aromia moschata TaxID=1265417 RepID=A0AAV8ZGZ2_9CUCU|nr:hypothetical protein NQ318_001242 [Aromia moschata]
MDKDFEVVVDNTSVKTNNDNQFYPFYVRRRSSVRSRSSLQSLQHRRNPRLVRRLVRKSGKSSIRRNTTNSQHFIRYLLDLSNTLIDISWSWMLLTVTIVFVLTWFMFAGLWMIISIDNVDVGNQTTEPCLEGINGFAGYLLFSVETQSTIGYGNRYLNAHCPEGVFLMCVQIIVGMCICGSLILIVYLKMVRPHKLHSMNCFSKYAVICQRDGELCFIFRVRDTANKFESLTKISAYLVQKRNDELYLKCLKLESVGLLIWPVEVVHRITKDSPLWDLSAKDLILKKFEIVVVMDGTSLTTASMSRTTTSYLSREIKWGYRFTSCTEYDREKSKYDVNHSLFNKMQETDTPLCSGKKRREILRNLISIGVSDSTGTKSTSLNTSKYSSPLFQDLKIFQTCKEEDEVEEKNVSSIVTTSAVVHSENHITEEKLMQRQKQKMNALGAKSVTDLDVLIVKDGNKEEKVVDNDSSSENELTFQDLSIEDLTEKKCQGSREEKKEGFSRQFAKFRCYLQSKIKNKKNLKKSHVIDLKMKKIIR